VSVDHGDIQGIGRGDAPDLSPDGMHIAFNGQYGDIYVMDIRGKNKIQIAPSDSFSPHWSPDGTFIAFQKFINGKQTIWVVSKDGGWEKELVENEGWNNNEISWSK
jgi:Tol biopolymer transport system component